MVRRVSCTRITGVSLTSKYINLYIICYSILYMYFTPSTEKNDSSVVLKRLNPEGHLSSYLCDVTLPAFFFLSRVSFFSVDKKVNKDFFCPDENIYIFFSFSPGKFLNPCLSCVPLSFVPPYNIISLCKSFFDFLILLIPCSCHEFSRLFMKIVRDNCRHIKVLWVE